MNSQLEDSIKSIALGVLMPAVLTFLALPYLRGLETRTRGGIVLNEMQAVGRGCLFLGAALCIHAFFLRGYENHPALRRALLFAGTAVVVTSLYLSFQ